MAERPSCSHPKCEASMGRLHVVYTSVGGGGGEGDAWLSHTAIKLSPWLLCLIGCEALALRSGNRWTWYENYLDRKRRDVRGHEAVGASKMLPGSNFFPMNLSVACLMLVALLV